MPNPAQSEPYADLLPIDRFPGGWSWLGKLTPLALIAFFGGVAATLAWQSYRDAPAPRPTPTAPNVPDLIAQAASAAASPYQQQVNAMSLDLEAMWRSILRIAASQDQITRNIDRIAASQEQMTPNIGRIAANQDQMTPNIDRIAATQEQIAHGVDQLAAGQEPMTREIIKIQEVEPYVLYKNSKPQPRPAFAPAPTPMPQPPPAPYDATRTAAEAQAHSAKAKGIAIERQAEPVSLQPTMHLDRKPTEASPPQTLAERGKQAFASDGHDPTCFPSASAVLQNHPGVWPSWTLRAPGHQGTRCWYVATRTITSDRRSGLMPFETTENGIAAPPARVE